MRETLPTRRKSVTYKVKLGAQSLHFTVGFYADGRVGELFIDLHRQGTALRAWADSSAMLVSLLLQHGAPLESVVRTMRGINSELSESVEVTGYKGVDRASGALDCVAQVLEKEFLGR